MHAEPAYAARALRIGAQGYDTNLLTKVPQPTGQ